MRVRGAVRGFRTLTRVALVGIIGGGAAACSSDASRLTSPFANPFAEPAATGSLPDDEPKPVAPLRTGRIQSEALGAPGAARPAPMASAIPAPAAAAPARVASVGSSGWSAQGGTRITVAKSDSLQQMATRYGVPASAILQANGLTSASQITPGRELVIPSYSNVSGLNPAAASMTARPARAVEERREDAKALEAREKEAKAQAQEKALETKRLAAKEKEAKDLAARKAAEAKAAEAKVAEAKAAEAKAAEEKARKLAALKEGDKKHVRPGQTPKVAETKADKAREEAKTAAKAEAAQKLAEAKAARDAAKAAAKETAKETTKQAAAERSAKEKVAKAEAKAETAKIETKAPAKVEVAKAEPAKAEPAATGSVAAAQSDAENFRWPAKGRVIAGYGSSGNEGINIALPEGTPVKAAEDGTVAYAGSDVKGYGKLVLVRHSNGFVSAYAHNGELDVKPGDKVKRGQTIAKSGASGNVTSPQLHFEIRKSGAPVDPMSQLASN
ncbi:MAG: peptidoglycan DD-metalloendopeptidase family protein [Actinomycetospora chiangmaiensis]|nr:peptidoglycan DD-metalloendopeptidase family protein [Actinomycetospora chiangmaiensis]